jgi:hypothetical protein
MAPSTDDLPGKKPPQRTRIFVFTAIRDAIAGHPWIPPIQASA